MATQQHLELLTSGFIRKFIGFKKASKIIYETINNYSERKHITIGLCGYLRSGKSTLGGRMYYEFNHRNHSKTNILNDDKWSCYFDEDEEETIRQMTIHGNIHEVYTMSYIISLIDTPGNIDYMKNFIRFISQSDVVILVFAANDLMEKRALSNMPSTPNTDKLSFEGYYQLLDKLKICKLFEIDQLIIAINKLDKFNYSKSKYLQCQREIEKLLKFVGYNKYKNKMPIIPISAINGDNITNKSLNNKLKWWLNEGYKLEIEDNRNNIRYYHIIYTIYDAIESIKFNDIKMYNKDNIINIKPFKMSICSIYDETLNGSVLSGRVENGKISIGTTIRCFPSGCYGQIKSIEMFHKKCQYAAYGDIIGICLDSFLLQPHRGDIIINENNTKQYEIKSFECIIDVYPSNDKINKKYNTGFSPIIFCDNPIKQVQCQLINILWKINKTFNKSIKSSNGNIKFKQKDENAKYLEPGDSAKVLFEPNRQFAICALQKIIILEHKQIIMSGKVTKLHFTDEIIEDYHQ